MSLNATFNVATKIIKMKPLIFLVKIEHGYDITRYLLQKILLLIQLHIGEEYSNIKYECEPVCKNNEIFLPQTQKMTLWYSRSEYKRSSYQIQITRNTYITFTYEGAKLLWIRYLCTYLVTYNALFYFKDVDYRVTKYNTVKYRII